MADSKPEEWSERGEFQIANENEIVKTFYIKCL